MLFRRPTSRELREENERLRSALDEAHASLANYRQQEHELVETLVRARVEARGLLDSARAEARGILDNAAEESGRLREGARLAVASAEHDVARLRQSQHELGSSLQQSLAMLAPLLQRGAGRTAGPSIPPVKTHAGGTPAIPPARTEGASVSERPAVEARPETGTAATHPVAPRVSEAPRASRRSEPSVPAARADGFPPVRQRAAVAMSAVAIVVAATLAAWTWTARATPEAARTHPGLPSAEASAAKPATRVPKARTVAAAPTQSSAALSTITAAVEATRPVWVRADVDGKRILARALGVHEHVDLRARREIVIRAGDAGAVALSINGEPTRVLGADGAVVTRRIAVGAPVARLPVAATPPPSEIPPAISAARPTLPSVVSRAATDAATSASTGARPDPIPLDLPAAVISPPLEGTSGEVSEPLRSGLTPVENDVLRAHQAYFEALRVGDPAGILRLQGRAFTATGVAPPIGATGLSFSQVSVQVSGVGAVVSGRAFHAGDAGSDGKQWLLFSEVWTKSGDQWQLLSVRFVEPSAPR